MNKDIIIHARPARFASERRDFRVLPVEGSVAYSGRKSHLSHVVGLASVILALGTLAYMLGRVVFSAVFGG